MQVVQFLGATTSNDKGENWSEPLTVIDPLGTVRAFDQALWIAPNNQLWLFWSQCDGKDGVFDGIGEVGGYIKVVRIIQFLTDQHQYELLTE